MSSIMRRRSETPKKFYPPPPPPPRIFSDGRGVINPRQAGTTGSSRPSPS